MSALCQKRTFPYSAAERALTGNERRASGGAGLLAIVIRKNGTFVGNAVDVRRVVAHHAAIVGGDIPVADVIGHDDQDIRLGG